MAHLTLAGLSDDGKRLLLVSDKGVEFTLDIDARLRAALRGEHARLGQLEITDGQRTPPPRHPGPDPGRRDARGRGPGRADDASTRSCRSPRPCSPSGSTSPSAPSARPYAASRRGRRRRARPSATPSAAHLRSLNVDPDTVAWDAWRREDGRWTLTGDYAAGKRSGIGHVHLRRPRQLRRRRERRRPLAARRAASAAPAPRPARDDLKQARERRLSARPAHDELPLGDDAHRAGRRRDRAGQRRVRAASGAEQPVEAYLDDDRPPARRRPSRRAVRRADTAEQADAEPDPEPRDRGAAAPAKPAKKKGRASVPSWDEIMFGGGKSD